MEKIEKLERLIKFYTKFLNIWKEATIEIKNDIIKVTFFRINRHGYKGFTERSFSVDDIDKRILSYKRKIAKEFANRHVNTRLLRERETRKWEKYIEKGGFSDADI